MARITVEDCLQKVNTRFGLIHLAAKRVRQLRKGAEPMVVCKNKDIVVALREIAAGKIIQTQKNEISEGEENQAVPALEDATEVTEKESPDPENQDEGANSEESK